jgi:hypothetical protein
MTPEASRTGETVSEMYRQELERIDSGDHRKTLPIAQTRLNYTTASLVPSIAIIHVDEPPLAGPFA